ncbi:MAG TPA: hypothetical protein VF044_09645 [Actinomycetota bacterium]
MVRTPTRRAIAAGVAIALALSLAATAAFAGGDGGASTHAHAADAQHDEAAARPTRRAFHDTMRKLWEDHVAWTRLFIVSFAHDLPDLQATTDRLLRNQVDIGNAVKPFYGEAAADALTALLTEHITIAADVLAAAKAGDDEAFADARRAWYRNGRQIARFLHDANPEHWRLREMRSMMREHLDLTLAEAAHRLAGDYEADVEAYEAVHLAILHMADMLSRGIVRQFPGRFA